MGEAWEAEGEEAGCPEGASTPEMLLSDTLGELSAESRALHARRLLVRAAAFTPFILASVLTTKAVAATKVIGENSIPSSL